MVLGVTVHWGFAAAAGLYASWPSWGLYLIDLRGRGDHGTWIDPGS